MKESFRFGRNFLKIVALLTMVCDHAAFLIPQISKYRYIYEVLRWIGRISFPLFCFLLVQGFLTTHNVRRYVIRIFCFALLSEIPYDLMFYGKLFAFQSQNVLFTFCIAVFVLMLVQKCKGNVLATGVIVLTGCTAAWFLRTDYQYMGILMVYLFYLFRYEKGYQFFSVSILLFAEGGGEMFGWFALPLCYCYSEERVEKPLPKYFFYMFYPLHLLFLWGFRYLVL